MAHHEYLSKLNDTDRQNAASFDDWVDLLKNGNYGPIQQQLVNVLGAVPDGRSPRLICSPSGGRHGLTSRTIGWSGDFFYFEYARNIA